MHTMYRFLFLNHFLPKGEGYVSKCAVGSRVGMSKLKDLICITCSVETTFSEKKNRFHKKVAFSGNERFAQISTAT